MSNSKIAAVEGFRNLTKSLKALIALSDELEAVGNLQQASDELTAGVGKLRKERDALLAGNAEASAAAKADADAVKDAARKAADALLTDAKAKADKVIADANAAADTLLANAHADLADTEKKLAGCSAAVTDAQTRHAALESDVTALEAKMDKLQAQARKLLED